MKTRIISALVAIAVLFLTTWLFKTNGLFAIGAIATLGAILEYTRLTYARLDAPLHLRFVFIALCALIALTAVVADANLVLSSLVLASVFILTMTLMTVRRTEDLTSVLELQGLGVMGLFYCGLFPGLAIRLVRFDSIGIWLFGLMAIVFSGDTGAYLAGRVFGKRKLLEPVSPKKTVEGSIGGLLGSCLAGTLFGYFFVKDVSMVSLILMSLTTGAFAQIGDLYESLLKRIADVKDSGSIMPGHGGILDRIDGLLFAAPMFYVLVKILIAMEELN